MKKDIFTTPDGFFESFNTKMDSKLRAEKHRRRSLGGIAACLCICAAFLLFTPRFHNSIGVSCTTVCESDYISETLDLYESDIFLRNFEFE